MESDPIYKHVQDHYGAIAQDANASGEASRVISKAFGYSDQDLDNIPKEANLGLSCGNPLTIARLRKVKVTSESR